MNESGDETLIEVSKNDLERVRLQRSNYKGHDLLSLRVFAVTRAGGYVPTPKGVTLRRETWQELLPHITAELADEASKRGYRGRGSDPP